MVIIPFGVYQSIHGAVHVTEFDLQLLVYARVINISDNIPLWQSFLAKNKKQNNSNENCISHKPTYNYSLVYAKNKTKLS